jgi:cystathionine beta-synthase
MAAQGFGEEDLLAVGGLGVAPTPPWWASRSVADLAFHTPVTAAPTVSVKEAIGLLNSMGIDQLPVVAADNSILGVVTEGNLSARVLSGRAKGTDPVSSVLFKGFRKVAVATQLHQLARVFDTEHFAVVLQTQRVFVGGGRTEEKSVVVGVVTRIDLLKFISGGEGSPRSPGAAQHAASPGGGGGGGGGGPN